MSKKILILYGTTGGNTQMVCAYIQNVLQNKGYQTYLERVETFNVNDFAQYQNMIIASPTYGHGQLEHNFERFLPQLQNINLSHTKCGVVGLGDTKYDSDYVIESAKILEELLINKGASVCKNLLMIHKSPFSYFQKHIPIWVDQYLSFINAQ